MQARALRVSLVLLSLCSLGASHRTPNFIVTAPNPEIARQAGELAEQYRRSLSQEWLGFELRRWQTPCRLTVRPGGLSGSGYTTFAFERGRAVDWRMTVQGPLEEIYESVLPHEISHTIFASYFRRPLPRWADEGAALLAEEHSTRLREKLRVKELSKRGQQLPLRRLMGMRDYPDDRQKMMLLYSQGYSLADFLVERGGKPKFINFLKHSYDKGWDVALQRTYGFQDVETCEQHWNQWLIGADVPADVSNLVAAE
jgi:hypothetical protein